MRPLSKLRLTLSVFTAVLSFSNASYAATSGALSGTSTGTALISITKNVQAQITDLSDMTLANWNVGDGAVVLYSNACIYSSTGSYKVTASGSGLLGAFYLSSGLLNTISYTVAWNGGGAGNLTSSGTALSANVQSGTFNNADTTNATCTGGGANDTARVIVNVGATAMNSAPSSATAYTGTLTLLVTPY